MSGKNDERVFVRWVRIDDFLAVSALTRDCYTVPIPVCIFRDAIESPNKWMRVAVVRGQIVGMMVYERDGANLICDMCVHPDIRRRGIGTRLLGYVLRKLESGAAIAAEFCLTLPEAESFLRSFGAKCTGIKRRVAEQGGDLFVFQLKKKQGGFENAGV